MCDVPIICYFCDMKADEFVQKVQAFVDAHQLLDKGKCVLVALSGGADSVALLRVLFELDYSCIAAHCNFHLRGEESMRDQHFVEALCHKLSVPLVVKSFDVELYRQKHHVSMEMACRELRYGWFHVLRAEHQAQAIAVAHHRDDNLETMLLNLLRGTGIAGLTGMKPLNDGHVVRPMLEVTRSQVQDYLEALQQDYVTDSTNLENDFTRNKIRNIVLPALEREFPHARKALSTTMSNLYDVSCLYDLFVEEVLSHARTSNGYKLQVLLNYPKAKLLIYEALKSSGFTLSQCEEIEKCLRSKPHDKPVFYSQTHLLTLGTTVAFLEPIKKKEPFEYEVNLFDTSNLDVDLSVSFDNPPFNPAMCDGCRVVAFSNEILRCRSLLMRPWHRGDAMRPFGMNGTRKVSDILTGARYTREQKRWIQVLEADGTIIWVVGIRSGEAFRVQPGDTNYLLLTVGQ